MEIKNRFKNRLNSIEMNIDITCTEASIRPNGYKNIEVSISDANQDSILDEFKVEDIVSHFKLSDLLDAIGEDFCKEYFDLTKAE